MKVFTLALWVANYIIATSLQNDKVLANKGKGLLEFNVFAVVACGIVSLISSFGLDEDNVITIVSGIAAILILPCYAVAQIMVAVRLMS